MRSRLHLSAGGVNGRATLRVPCGMGRQFLVGALGLLATTLVGAETYRDPTQRAAFVKVHPCPATGKVRGACPGYVVDHIKPLCAGGADHPKNMQWQTIADAKVKDREERKICKR